jgi:hypothetical protein
MSDKMKGALLWAYVLLPLAWGVVQTIKKTMALFA